MAWFQYSFLIAFHQARLVPNSSYHHLSPHLEFVLMKRGINTCRGGRELETEQTENNPRIVHHTRFVITADCTTVEMQINCILIIIHC